MNATNDFFMWFYYGLNGLGGWALFLLFALIAIVWILYDSGSRRLPALGWKMSVIVSAGLILPAIVYRFTASPLSPLASFSELTFYLGVLGGLLPVVLSVGYYVNFQGMTRCPQGIHGAYESQMERCPQCARMEMQPAPVGVDAPINRDEDVDTEIPAPPLSPMKQKAQAWLVSSNGKSYQLYKNETTIGRHSSNDIYLSGDNTVSRQHAKLTERNGRFKLYDLGSKGLTRVNGRVVREPVLLEPDDEIKFGDNTVLRLVGTGH